MDPGWLGMQRLPSKDFGSNAMDDQGVQQDIAQVVEYVLRRGFKRVTLQFPDDQLQDAPLVAAAMSKELAAVSDAQVGRHC